jgi:hypothetical protein
MKEMTEAFTLVFAIGGLVSWASWHFTRHYAERSWWWRAILCVLFAATFTPTAFHLFHGLVVIPAIVEFWLIFQGETVSSALGLGALPILVVASLLFVGWSVFIRRHSHVA